MGRIRIGIPESMFDQENRNVQLKSFRDQSLNGPAISDVVTTWPGDPERLPSLTFALEAEAERRSAAMPTVEYRFAPDRGFSEAMFLDALLKALPGVLPAVGSLFGGGGGAKSGGGGSPLDAVLAALGSPQIQELVKQLLGQIAVAKSHATVRPLAMSAGSDRCYEPPARAMVAPLLAALPALMPLLQQVLTPDTIKAVLGAADPTKIIGAVTGSLKDLAGVGIENQKVILDHLKAVHPSLEDKELMGLLASMSVGAPASQRSGQPFQRTDKVKVEITGAKPLDVDGQSLVLYQLGKTLRFPLAVHTPHPIDQALVEVTLRKLDTREVIARKKAAMKITGSGPLARVPSFDAASLANVPSGTDCTLTVVVTWRSSSGKRVGTSITHWITLVKAAVISSVRRSGDALPLDDVTRYREFWHKVWDGPFDENRRRFELQVKYCYCIEPDARENARMETKVMLEEPQYGRSSCKVKTGMLLAPVALNALLPRTFDKAALSPDDLAAFSTEDAVDRFATSAQARMVLSGRPRGSAAAWVFPDVALHEVGLRTIGEVDENGQVLSTTERTVTFPLPVAAHFIGTRSGQ